MRAAATMIGSGRVSVRRAGACLIRFLRKEALADKEKLRDILARIRGLVHPTLADIAPLSLVEAAYFGCPSISSRICAIPEIVEDGKTGILLDAPPSVGSVAEAMERMIVGDQAYSAMRQAVRARMLKLFSKETFENRVRIQFEEALLDDPSRQRDQDLLRQRH